MTFFFTSVFIVLVFWRPQEWLLPWMFGYPVLDAVVWLLLMSFIVEVNAGKIRIPKNRAVIYMLIGLWAAAVLSHVANFYFQGMLDTIPEAFKYCFFTVLLFCILDSIERLRAVAIMFVVMACLMAVHAIMQQKLGYGFTGTGPIRIYKTGVEEPVVRSLFFGIFEDPNDLAQILVTSIPFAFILTKRRSVFGLVLGCAITYLLVQGVVATHSRSGFVALSGVAAVVFLLFLPSRWMPVLMACYLVGALGMCLFSGAWLDESAHDRVVFWGLANQTFKNSIVNFLFGIGYLMFGQVAGERAAHNAFVLCYTELGIVGYWFWFGLIVLGITGAWRTRVVLAHPATVEKAWIRRFAGLCIASTTGFLASGYFLSRTFIYPLFFLMAMLGALPVLADKYMEEEHPLLVRPLKDLLVFNTLATILSIAYIYFSIILLNRVFYD